MIYILYSNDYEVFLGGNYLPETEVLIETTRDVLGTCDELGVPMTLFCDLTCLWRYRELGYSAFPTAIEKQLVQAIGMGHDVQTHIHPHWFETKIEIGENGSSTYKVDPSKFLIGNWLPNEGTSLRAFCAEVFGRAKKHLEDLLSPVHPDYQCLAYRAGGYGVQPNSADIYNALLDAGYTIDSSIVPGMKYESNVNRIDFTKVPKLGNYSISPEQGISQASEIGVFEIPVLALKDRATRWLLTKSFFRKVAGSFIKKEKRKHKGYPIQMSEAPSRQKTLIGQILDEIKIIWDGFYMLELGEDPELMIDVATSYINRYSASNKDLFVSISCHSKSINPQILDALKTFHKRLEIIYGNQMKAITFQDAKHYIDMKKKES